MRPGSIPLIALVALALGGCPFLPSSGPTETVSTCQIAFDPANATTGHLAVEIGAGGPGFRQWTQGGQGLFLFGGQGSQMVSLQVRLAQHPKECVQVTLGLTEVAPGDDGSGSLDGAPPVMDPIQRRLDLTTNSDGVTDAINVPVRLYSRSSLLGVHVAVRSSTESGEGSVSVHD